VQKINDRDRSCDLVGLFPFAGVNTASGEGHSIAPLLNHKWFVIFGSDAIESVTCVDGPTQNTTFPAAYRSITSDTRYAAQPSDGVRKINDRDRSCILGNSSQAIFRPSRWGVLSLDYWILFYLGNGGDGSSSLEVLLVKRHTSFLGDLVLSRYFGPVGSSL